MADQIATNQDNYPYPEDWRGEMMIRIRALIKAADSTVTEEVKWKTASNPKGVLAWYHDGLLLTGEIYQQHLRLSFAKGPELKAHDPQELINSYRAVIIRPDDQLNETAFKNLIKAAVRLNVKV